MGPQVLIGAYIVLNVINIIVQYCLFSGLLGLPSRLASDGMMVFLIMFASDLLFAFCYLILATLAFRLIQHLLFKYGANKNTAQWIFPPIGLLITFATAIPMLMISMSLGESLTVLSTPYYWMYPLSGAVFGYCWFRFIYCDHRSSRPETPK